VNLGRCRSSIIEIALERKSVIRESGGKMAKGAVL